MLDNLTKILAISTSAFVLFSVTYDLAYFIVIDPSMVSVLSLSDHLASAIQAVPAATIIGLGLVMGPGAPIWRSRTELPRLVLFESEGLALFIKRRRPRFLVALTIAITAIALFYPTGWIVMFVPGVAWWEFACFRMFQRNSSNRPGILRTMLFLVPAYLLIAIMLGATSGYVQVHQTDGQDEIRLTDSTQIDGVLLIRTTDKGLLFRVPPSSASDFVPWSQIAKFTLWHRAASLPRSFVCRFTGVCPIDRYLEMRRSSRLGSP